MKDEILDAALKVLKGEIAIMNKELNDEAVDKKMKSLTNQNCTRFPKENGKLEAEFISVRHGADYWRAGVNNVKGQLLDEVRKDIENDLVEIKKSKVK